MKPQLFHHIFRALFALFILLSLVLSPQAPARAAAVLTIEPITWNVIGLDSNNVNVGPNHFPVGARVCNTGDTAALNVQATFVWDSTNTYINIRPGTSSALTLSSLSNVSPNNCYDFYFEVEVTRTPSAYNTTRRYHIDVSATGLSTISTPTPRELFVEYLISQSRNATTKIELSTDNGSNWNPFGPGDTMTLMVGSTYLIKLWGYTATNGYEQIETFISLPNTIFQTLSVTTTYTADTSSHVSSPSDKLYGNACNWENAPSSPNYRSCLDTGKVGGNITVTYKVKILSIPDNPLDNPEALQSLIYDFSGSSYHYNSDFGGGPRTNIVTASIAKSFSPKAIKATPPETSTLTFTITNPGPAVISSVNFTDTLPTNVTIASTTVTYTGCGTPSPSSLTVGQSALSFSNITVNSLSTCTISVTVTASIVGTYVNTTGHLFIGTIDTGSYGTDTLIVTNQPPGPNTCTPRVTLATWTMPTSGQGSGGPPPPYTTKAADVSTATASSTNGTGGVPGISTTLGNPLGSWYIAGGWNNLPLLPSSTGSPYFQFTIDTSNYGGVGISFDEDQEGPGDWTAASELAWVYSQADTGAFTAGTSTVIEKGKWSPVAYTIPLSSTTGLGTTTFRMNFERAPVTKPDAIVYLDNVIITGCPRPLLPTLSKAFNPVSIIEGNASTLTFTFTNPNSTTILSGVAFTDTLPSGLVINTPNGLTTPTCSTGTILGQSISAPAGGTTINMSGATLSAGASCSFAVSVLGNVAGQYHNVSGNITSTQTGPNTTSTGFGVADLLVIAPPIIAKDFGATSIISGTSTSLTFGILNPNTTVSLTGVAFTDNLPSGIVVANPSYITGTCDAGTITAIAASSTVSLSGATLTAGSSCSFSVKVTGTSVGFKENYAPVTSTNGGPGNTAYDNILVRVLTPSLALRKQVGPTATGPWTTYLLNNAGDNVYYRFIIENTGDVPLTNIGVVDANVNTSSCSWTDPLPVADTVPPIDDDHITTCVVNLVTPIIALSGRHPNIARAQGDYNSTTYYSNYSTATYENGPTPVIMASFDAIATPWEIKVSWETVSELNALGFNLYRATDPDGEWVRLNQELIPSRAQSGFGALYQFNDPDVLPGVTYYYWLEFFDFSGKVFGPEPATVLDKKIFLPAVVK